MDMILQHISNSYVFFDIEAGDRRTSIYELLEKANARGAGLDIETTAHAVLSNEKNLSSGLGYGVAFPHAHIANIKETTMIFGISKKGVDFFSRDSKPAHLIVLFLTPPDEKSEYIANLSTMAKMSHLTMYIVLLLESKSEQEFKEKLSSFLKDGLMPLDAV